MKLDFIPFKIGMHYENWEFDLELEESSETYDMFRYVKGDIKEVLGFEVTDIFLYFHLDILFQVEFFLEQGESQFEEFHEVKNGLSIRGRIEEQTKLIELTYSKEGIWREL